VSALPIPPLPGARSERRSLLTACNGAATDPANRLRFRRTDDDVYERRRDSPRMPACASTGIVRDVASGGCAAVAHMDGASAQPAGLPLAPFTGRLSARGALGYDSAVALGSTPVGTAPEHAAWHDDDCPRLRAGVALGPGGRAATRTPKVPGTPPKRRPSSPPRETPRSTRFQHTGNGCTMASVPARLSLGACSQRLPTDGRSPGPPQLSGASSRHEHRADLATPGLVVRRS
jgi:hypothetical protein